MNLEQKILVAIDAARQIPGLKLMKVHKELKEKLKIKKPDLERILSNLEAGGMIAKNYDGGWLSYVLTPAGREYIKTYNKNFADELLSAAKTGNWLSLASVLAEQVFKDRS